jgi:hypothetical protein
VNEVLWAASRATALSSIVLLTVTFVLGMLTSARTAGTTGGRVVSTALHRTLALLMVAFIAVHVITAIAETYVDIGWISALVPFTSAYQTVWIGLGTLALDLVLALIITSLLRHRLPTRLWRGIHWASYALWPIAVVHGLTSVTVDKTLTYGLIAACAVAAAAALVVRLVRTPADTGRRRLGSVHTWRIER